MKLIIFAGGKGLRMRPLTLYVPKPLLVYRRKTNLDHLFDVLPKEIDEAIFVVRYLAEKIRKHCGTNFHGRKISYITDEGKGTGTALIYAQPLIAKGERFAIAYGDEVFVGDEIVRCLKPLFSWLCYRVTNPTEVGIVTIDSLGKILDVVEKPPHPLSDLAADGFMVVNSDIFNCVPYLHSRGEYYLTDMMSQFLKTHEVKAVMASEGHTQLTEPADIERLNKVRYAKWL